MILNSEKVNFSYVGGVREEVVELALLTVLLQEDVRTAADAYNGNRSGFAARVLVRAALSYVEGALFRLRFVLLALACRDGALQPEQILVLRDEAPALTESGKVETRSSFAQTQPFLKFVLKTYACVLGSEHLVDMGGSGYAALKASISVRNRITHPKHRTHLRVTQDELDQLQKGIDWFTKTLEGLLAKQQKQLA